MSDAMRKTSVPPRTIDALNSRYQKKHIERYKDKQSGQFECIYYDMCADGVASLLNVYQLQHNISQSV